VRNAETDWLNTELDRQRLGLTDIILCEVLQGVRDDVIAREVHTALTKCEVFDTGGVTLALEAARNYRPLRSRGHTVRKTIDCLIATFCLRDQHSLLQTPTIIEAAARHREGCDGRLSRRVQPDHAVRRGVVRHWRDAPYVGSASYY
jgi:predicted nucleic acid-binding protein